LKKTRKSIILKFFVTGNIIFSHMVGLWLIETISLIFLPLDCLQSDIKVNVLSIELDKYI